MQGFHCFTQPHWIDNLRFINYVKVHKVVSLSGVMEQTDIFNLWLFLQGQSVTWLIPKRRFTGMH